MSKETVSKKLATMRIFGCISEEISRRLKRMTNQEQDCLLEDSGTRSAAVHRQKSVDFQLSQVRVRCNGNWSDYHPHKQSRPEGERHVRQNRGKRIGRQTDGHADLDREIKTHKVGWKQSR